jgi:urease accessory protein
MKTLIGGFKFQKLLPLILVVLAPSLAQAHPGMPGHSHGLTNGLVHPITGLDHLLAMIAVGLWAAQRGGRALWAVPLTFVSVMVLGHILGVGGASIPFVEQGIVASVLILGLLVAAAVKLPVTASAAIVAVFALFHGFAHGAEMPASASGLTYGIGFVVMTAVLHLVGIGLGNVVQRHTGDKLVRIVGGTVAAFGAYFCFAI